MSDLELIINSIKESTNRVSKATLWIELNKAIKNPDPVTFDEVIRIMKEQQDE